MVDGKERGLLICSFLGLSGGAFEDESVHPYGEDETDEPGAETPGVLDVDRRCCRQVPEQQYLGGDQGVETQTQVRRDADFWVQLAQAGHDQSSTGEQGDEEQEFLGVERQHQQDDAGDQVQGGCGVLLEIEQAGAEGEDRGHGFSPGGGLVPRDVGFSQIKVT